MRALQERAVICRRLAMEAERLGKTEEGLEASHRAKADEALRIYAR
jgi:hypothetical protein